MLFVGDPTIAGLAGSGLQIQDHNFSHITPYLKMWTLGLAISLVFGRNYSQILILELWDIKCILLAILSIKHVGSLKELHLFLEIDRIEMEHRRQVEACLPLYQTENLLVRSFSFVHLWYKSVHAITRISEQPVLYP